MLSHFFVSADKQHSILQSMETNRASYRRTVQTTKKSTFLFMHISSLAGFVPLANIVGNYAR